MKIKIAGVTKESIVDGEGIRFVIWVQGCKHNCKGCQNKETHDFSGGKLVDVEDIKKEIDNLNIQRGITISGGEPFEQAVECMEIAKYTKELGYSVWVYTGYTFEELVKDEVKLKFLQQVDILVDGKFKIEERDLSLNFRGSRNQRIIDVQKSLKEKEVVEVAKYSLGEK